MARLLSGQTSERTRGTWWRVPGTRASGVCTGPILTPSMSKGASQSTEQAQALILFWQTRPRFWTCFTEGTDQNAVYYDDDVFISVTGVPEPENAVLLLVWLAVPLRAGAGGASRGQIVPIRFASLVSEVRCQAFRGWQTANVREVRTRSTGSSCWPRRRWRAANAGRDPGRRRGATAGPKRTPGPGVSRGGAKPGCFLDGGTHLAQCPRAARCATIPARATHGPPADLTLLQSQYSLAASVPHGQPLGSLPSSVV